MKSEKPISFKKLSAVSQASANPATMAVKMDRTHHLNDEDESEVMKEQVISGFVLFIFVGVSCLLCCWMLGYWYGKDLVPFLSVDQQQMKFKSPKCLKVLGFTKLFNVSKHSLI